MAAAVFVPPSPHDALLNMSAATRRAPLANISNATNSPHRLLTNSASKRSRAVANFAQQENEPPQKRVALDKLENGAVPVTPRRKAQSANAEGKVFERGTGEAGSTTLQKRLVAARDKSNTSRAHKANEASSKDVENIRQWQKHYRRIFPGFSFYFDSVSEDQKSRFLRVINHLGAREEKFFSKTVTHIVTTRPIPTDNVTSKDPSDTADAMAVDEHAQTINPSLLERNPNSRSFSQNNTTVRRDAPMDILTRGRQMGMKIWAAEKLSRILTSIVEDATIHISTARGHSTHSRAHEDLSQVLKNERINATSEKEQASIPRELVPFRGPFIYIHDIDEKVRPTMVREYPKVARRQDGEWPQFRSATVGKCPFIEDPALKKEEQERVKQKALLVQQQQKEAQQTHRTRSAVASVDVKMDPPRRTSPRKALQSVQNAANPAPVQQSTFAAQIGKVERQSSFPPMPEQPPVNFVQPSQMHLAREPAASGIQRSNITSAIQSQMISSTAGTGVKTSTSKEVHELKRKVLERSHTGSLSVGSIPSSHRMNDLAGVLKNARAPAPQRAAKSKAQEKLGGIQEEVDPYADDASAERAVHTAARKRKATKKDPKPGYCENCRDKYDDFEEHVVSRKHRKFAMTQSNWDELDALLHKLQAP